MTSRPATRTTSPPSFSNDNEVAQAGYYSARSNQPNTIKSEFTATPHSAMARFTYPTGQQAGFLIKLHDSQNGEYAPSTASSREQHRDPRLRDQRPLLR